MAVIAGCGGSAARGAGTATTVVPAGRVALRTVTIARFHTRALADGAGHALYIFAPDHRRAVTCFGTCALTWPPVTVAAGRRPRVGAGVEAGLVGVIKDMGRYVVTYNGWPLYSYVADVSPRTASGEGIDLNGGAWYLMRPDGQAVVPKGQPPLDVPPASRPGPR
jgi:predicted lipoprotein with Yx(FWY)xxD motif